MVKIMVDRVMDYNLVPTPGFELTFQNCIVKNTYKVLLVLVLPKCIPWLDLRDRKCQHFACYMLHVAGKCISQCKLRHLVKAMLLTTRPKNEKCLSNERNLIQPIKITWSKP